MRTDQRPSLTSSKTFALCSVSNERHGAMANDHGDWQALDEIEPSHEVRLQ
jgi:hypothetical protein